MGLSEWDKPVNRPGAAVFHSLFGDEHDEVIHIQIPEHTGDWLERDFSSDMVGHSISFPLGRAVMTWRRRVVLATLGLLLFGMTGCDGGLPPEGSRAITPQDLLARQQVKIAEAKAKLKAQSISRSIKRR
jgi:hypothetical protein